MKNEQNVEFAENMKSAASKLEASKNDEKYFKKDELKENIDEFKAAVDTAEKAKVGAKIVGKSLFNAGLYTKDKVLPGLMRQMAKKALEKK